MKPFALPLAALFLVAAARADFQYVTTTKQSSGMMAGFARNDGRVGGNANGTATKHFFKGDKMKTETGNTALIFDFGAGTTTTINHANKTYKVSPMGEMLKGAGDKIQMSADVKETGQKKTINGYAARQVVMTVIADAPQARKEAGMGEMKMKMTMDLWVSSDVPGASELRSFYQKFGEKFPWHALGGGNSGLADMQKKMTSINGVPVLQVVKMGMTGDDAKVAQMNQQMAEARAQLEAMQKKGGQQAAAAQQALAMMGQPASGGGGTLMEMTMESSGFSTASIAAAEFQPPAGYKQEK